jgi:hypothetical protein
MHGVRVPGDIAVVGHDDLLASSIAIPSLTTIAPPRFEMGRACVDLLRRAQSGEQLPRVHMLEAMFRVRESTVGSLPSARGGIDVGLSDPLAWSRWRESSVPAPAGPAAALARVALEELIAGEEVSLTR